MSAHYHWLWIHNCFLDNRRHKTCEKNGTALPWLRALIPGCSPSSRGFFNGEPLGGGFFQIFYLHPKYLGKMGFQFDGRIFFNIFQMGWWFNHQLRPNWTEERIPNWKYQRLSTKCSSSTLRWLGLLIWPLGGRCWTGGFLVGADVFVEGQENPTILPFNACFIQRYCQIQENIGWFPQFLVIRKHEPENSEIIWCQGLQEDAKMQEQMLAHWSYFYQVHWKVFYPQDASFDDVILVAVSTCRNSRFF